MDTTTGYVTFRNKSTLVETTYGDGSSPILVSITVGEYLVWSSDDSGIYRIKVFIIMILRKFIKTTIREYLNENQKYDNKVGKQFWFEYHCYESPDSCDAELWYRSHQKVKVIGVSEWSHDDLQDRIEDATPRVYKIRFEDGFEYDAWEDEIVDSPVEFYRPKPPKRG